MAPWQLGETPQAAVVRNDMGHFCWSQLGAPMHVVSNDTVTGMLDCTQYIPKEMRIPRAVSRLGSVRSPRILEASNFRG